LAQIKADTLNLQESVIHINRVAKVVKAAALLVHRIGGGGRRREHGGHRYGKPRSSPGHTEGHRRRRKNLFVVPKHGTTITHEVLGHHGAGRVLLRPASAGTALIAGGGVRALLELGGVHDVLTKCLAPPTP